MAIVKVVELSENTKLGPVSATYAPFESCPPCPLEHECYGRFGKVGIIESRLDASGLTPLEIARAEAEAIRELSGRNDLRVHVVGDCRTRAAARAVSAACRAHRRKRGRLAWSYTHAHGTVLREDWAGVSVLASVESAEGALAAMDEGWAAALVVPRFESAAAYRVGRLKVLPCPYQTREVQCADCRLCWDDARLRSAGIAIGFAAHGPRNKSIAGRLSLEVVV